MKLIKPQVELWPASDDWQDVVARAARLCYASEGGQKSAEDFCEMLKKRGHVSMFRHGSRYFIIPNVNMRQKEGEESVVPSWLFTALTNSPYVNIVYYKSKKHHRSYFLSTNEQYVQEHPMVMAEIKTFEVTLEQFCKRAQELNFTTAFMCIRYTVCVTTQISTSRELNRTSPNAIAEQSTRYVNFGKKGGITICQPHWYDCAHWSKKILARVSWKWAEWSYLLALKLGLPAQDARGFLPLDAGTRACYTYSAFEWRNIMRLRLTGATGKPHPNAHIAAQQIHDAIVPYMKQLCGSEQVLV